MVKKATTAQDGRFDKEANIAAIRAARPGKQTWYDFRPDLFSYPRESSKGAAVVDAIVEHFCRRNLSFTVADIEACRIGVPQEYVRGEVARQLTDLVRDEYVRRTSAGYQRVPPESLDEFSGRGNGGELQRAQSHKPKPQLQKSAPATVSDSAVTSLGNHTAGELADTTEADREITTVEIQLENESYFDPTNIGDGRTRVVASIVRRRGQPAFRQVLLSAYNSRCAISSCDVVDVLEAAHIIPYKGVATNQAGNGLLLRADLHTLFDLLLISVDESTMQLLVSQKLDGTDYGEFRGQLLIVPDDPGLQPNSAALRWHRERSGLHPVS